MAVDLKHTRSLWDVVDQTQEKLDEQKWLIAESLWKANREDGVPMRLIAQMVGRTTITVGRWVRVWERYGGKAPRLTFTDAYFEYRKREFGTEARSSGRQRWQRSDAKKFLRESLTEEVEQVFMELPKERRKELRLAISAIDRKTPKQPTTDPAKLLRELSLLSERLVEVIDKSDDPKAILDDVATYIYPFQVLLRKPSQNGKPTGRLIRPAR